MATLSRKFHVYSDGSIRHEAVTTPAGALPSDKTFMRVLHELELAASLPHTTPPGRPEVRALFPNHFVPFGQDWQRLSYALNPYCTPSNWTAIYHNNLWISNNNGFGEDSDRRANYILNKDLSYPPPGVEDLTCGGNLLSVIGEKLEKTNLGLEPCYIVETLDVRQPAPAPAWLEARPWLITHAVNMGMDGTPRRFTMGMQDNGFVPGVRHPFVANPARFQVCIPKWRVVRWTQSTPPDPYRVYSPV